MPSLGSVSSLLAWAAIHSGVSVRLMKPGPLTCGGSATPVRSRWPMISAAMSRGGRPSLLASGRAALDWKSANEDGRITGSAAAYSVPNAAPSASCTRRASTSLGSAICKA